MFNFADLFGLGRTIARGPNYIATSNPQYSPDTAHSTEDISQSSASEPKAPYMIGNTPNGQVQLRIDLESRRGSVTLTMSTPAVRNLIKQLEAAIVEFPKEEN